MVNYLLGLEHIISSGHTNPFIMRSEVKSGESVWSSESVTKLRTVIPSKSCISKETGGSTCTDIPGWHDKDGPAYNCAWYAIGSNCDDYGHGWKVSWQSFLSVTIALHYHLMVSVVFFYIVLW